jgi:hypothetical protein
MRWLKESYGMRKDIGEEYLGPLSTKEGFTMHISLTRPFTRGSLRLRSSDPQVRGGEGDLREREEEEISRGVVILCHSA